MSPACFRLAGPRWDPCVSPCSVRDLVVLAFAQMEPCVVSWHIKVSFVLAETRVSPAMLQSGTWTSWLCTMEPCVVSLHIKDSHVLAETRVSPASLQRDWYVLPSLHRNPMWLAVTSELLLAGKQMRYGLLAAACCSVGC